jgi:carboxyl-terminal processing protease
LATVAFFERGKILGLAGCLAMLASCGGGSGSSGPPTGGVTPTPTPTPAPTAATCSLSARQTWARDQINEWYLFPNLLNLSASQASYTSVQDYIDALVAPARAESRDRYFTYITSIAEENAYYQQGAVAGFGFRLGYDVSARRVFVIESFENTSALTNGLDRGAEILEINGQTVNSLMAVGGPQAVIDAMGPGDAGVTRNIRYRELSGVERTVQLTKTVYALQPVSSRYGARVIDDGGRKVGYLNLRTFIDTAAPSLSQAFDEFKAQGVTDLIVDVRYNGGGLISIAETLGDLMSAGRAGQVSGYMTFRPSKSTNDETFTFNARSEAIAPTRIAFIGTGSTASASEMVINMMVPFYGNNMALVGANTYGKPVGQIARDREACDDRLRVVALKIENRDRQGEYYTGLASTVPVTCRAADDIAHQLGDPNEGMVRGALDFLAGRSCTAIGAIGVQALPRREVLAPARPRSTTDLELPGVF